MDYEQLLRKYIEHVRQAEGTDFIGRLSPSLELEVELAEQGSDVEFTAADVSALRRLAAPNTGQGCKKRLAPGQHWAFCGETDMGQTAPALCTECGGEYKLA